MKAKMLKTVKLAGSYQAIKQGEIVTVIYNPYPSQPLGRGIRMIRYGYLAISQNGLEILIRFDEFEPITP